MEIKTLVSIGIVIPIHNNSLNLKWILKSLESQHSQPEEIVVVNDNSSHSQRKKSIEICKKYGVRFEELQSPRNYYESLGRRSHARNLGMKSLETDVILFIDGDILLNPNYIKALRYIHEKYDNIYLRGKRISLTQKDQELGLDHCLRNLIHYQNDTEVSYNPKRRRWLFNKGLAIDRWEWMASNNLSVKAKDIKKIGLWDENFYGWGEEDIEFSYRLNKIGLIPLICNSDFMAAYHIDHVIDENLNRKSLINNANYFLKKYPEVKNFRIDAYKQHNIKLIELMK